MRPELSALVLTCVGGLRKLRPSRVPVILIGIF